MVIQNDNSARRVGKILQFNVMEYHTTDLDKFISSIHYLGYTPAGAKLRLGVLEDGIKVIGAMMWGRPSSKSLDQEKILELTRMVMVDDTDKFAESHSLALARKYIRQHHPQVKLVIAYSDPEQNHDGGIYEADNWCELGYTDGGVWTSISKPNRRDAAQGKKLRWVRSP